MKKVSPLIAPITKFLPKEKVKLFCGADWGREVKACKDVLVESELTIEQFSSIEPPKFVINSINWFKTANGKKYIIEQKNKWSKSEELSNRISVLNVKDYRTDEAPVLSLRTTKPKNILQFLNHG